MTEPLRIAVISPVWFAVPPTGYGGIEWVVSLLADGLVDEGHDVTLFASGDSQTDAKLSAVYPEAQSHLLGRSLPEIHHALACYARAGDFDVINDHSGMSSAFGMFAAQGSSGSGLRWLSEIEIRPTCGATRAICW